MRINYHQQHVDRGAIFMTLSLTTSYVHTLQHVPIYREYQKVNTCVFY